MASGYHEINMKDLFELVGGEKAFKIQLNQNRTVPLAEMWIFKLHDKAIDNGFERGFNEVGEMFGETLIEYVDNHFNH